jgi:hypothetical protein
MADTCPTKVSFIRALYLCLLLIFTPKKFLAEEAKDNRARNNFLNSTEREHSAFVVRRALGWSLLLVLFSGLIGYALGLTAGQILGCASPKIITTLQILGALILLWGTLFIRGWEIQTFDGGTLTERVNQWLYRFLYCLGTAIIVFTLGWPQCNG